MGLILWGPNGLIIYVTQLAIWVSFWVSFYDPQNFGVHYLWDLLDLGLITYETLEIWVSFDAIL